MALIGCLQVLSSGRDGRSVLLLGVPLHHGWFWKGVVALLLWHPSWEVGVYGEMEYVRLHDFHVIHCNGSLIFFSSSSRHGIIGSLLI